MSTLEAPERSSRLPKAGFQSDDIGREFDASGKCRITDYRAMAAGMGHFSAGTLMAQNGHGAPTTLAYLRLTYRWIGVNRKAATP